MSTESLPDIHGNFGIYGGMHVPPPLVAPLTELAAEYRVARKDPAFQAELDELLANFAGRPTPLYFAQRLTESLGGAKIYLKREDLLHAGAHKINNSLGQILLARRMGKKRVIAETGAGQHGVATATVAAHFGLECVIYMGAVDMERQALNVARMRFLGATVMPVTAGQATLKDAVDEAIMAYVNDYKETHYVLGSALGPHPYPMMVRDFQRVIGVEARKQILEREGRLPDLLVACIGGGSNAIGLFHAFLEDKNVRTCGVEGGGEGIKQGKHAARFQTGRLGILHGTKTYILSDEEGNVLPTHSISAGMDYAGIGPEHSYLRDTGRGTFDYATDDQALHAFVTLSKMEGIIPALESSHAVAHAMKVAPQMSKDEIIIVNLSGRGDKDVAQVADRLLKGC